MTEKVSKVTAQYTPWSKVPGQQCQGCSMFRKGEPGTKKTSGNRCTAVRGQIAAKGWCRFWEKKA